MDFKAGDVVKLKSGGLPMTIAWINSGEARCEWFDTKYEPQARSFALALLVHAES